MKTERISSGKGGKGDHEKKISSGDYRGWGARPHELEGEMAKEQAILKISQGCSEKKNFRV